MPIERVVIVVPARNEEQRLPACLDAIESAAAQVTVPVIVVVVLDRCTDGSFDTAQSRPGVTAIELEAGNVGMARAIGTELGLRLADASPDRVWIASTDADSTVPINWLSSQLSFAANGFDAVLGTVDVTDWSSQPAHVATAWTNEYDATERHCHIHGANLGLSAKAYLDVGGWRPMPAHEDVALVDALQGKRIARTAAHPVITSARQDARARGGFGDALRDLTG